MSRHRRTPRNVPRIAVQVLVVLALLGGVGLLASHGFTRATTPDVAAQTQAPPPTGQQIGQFFVPPPTLLVVTDSIGGGADPTVERNYPQVLAEEFGWNLVLDAIGGRGYLESDLSNIGLVKPVGPFLDNLQYDVDNFKADYILVDGGRNDLGKDPAKMAAAMDEYLTQLRSAYPEAKIFVIVPAYISPQKAALYDLAAQAARNSGEKIGAYVLDPVAEGWYEGVDLAPLMYKDGIHLNQAGAEYYASKIAEALERAGVEPQNSDEVGIK